MRHCAGLVFFAILVSVAPSAGQEAAPTLSEAEIDQRTAEIASELRCPVCRNQSVLESSASLARQMQREIREKVVAGWNRERVRAFFIERYGDWILLQPEPSGFNVLVYALPAAGLLLGLVVVGAILRGWSRRRPTPATGTETEAPEPPDDPLSSEDRAWLERAIRG